MASSTQHPAHTHELLGRAAEWQFRDSLQLPSDLERYCKANSAIEFKRKVAEVSFCVLFSAGCSHLASVEASPSEKSIKVAVYRLRNGFEQKWTVTCRGTDEEFQTSESSLWCDTAQMHGGVTEDGQTVLLVYRPAGGHTTAYIVNANGFTRRKPPSDTGSMYSSSAGEVSEDSEYIFYTRSGTAFGKNGEAKVVEVYFIRHLTCFRAVTFGFGDGRHLRNTQLLPQLRARGPIYMAIETSSFDGEDGERNSPPLVASSDRKLHWNFAGINQDITRGGSSTFISADDAHMFYVEPDAAMLHHWDLKNPSLRPLGSVRLPGVEYSKHRRWLIHGKETSIKDAVAKQIHHARYSPNCKVITVVTVNELTVVINVLLTFNLQLVYHQTVRDPKWPGLVPLRVGFNDSTGLNVCAMYPTVASNTQDGLLRLFGVSGILISLPEIFKKVKNIEDYFDSTGDRVATLIKDVDNKEAYPECRFGWKPGFMERNDPAAIALELGQSSIITAEDARRQQEFYAHIFAHPKSSVRLDSTPELRHLFVPHLFSFTYPWAPEQRVSVFGVVMKYEYHIIAIGPSPSMPKQGSEVVRALYATDIKVSGDVKQHIEVYKSGSNYILHVSQMGGRIGGCYSGAPMPIPRWTVISPHFLEEDAWYDTFVIHQASHVTMPTGWIQTPNEALISATIYYAYFEPRTFAVQDVVDYGHRARSAYVLPKYLLWQKYGLRGFQGPNPIDIFGGGCFADNLGHYFRSIYEDKTYDDSNPLFPSTFAMACNVDHRAQRTEHVDAFFRRLHQSNDRLLDNSRAISCTLPVACRARPIASLSFMRHVALYPHKVNDIGAVEVKNGATKLKQTPYESRWHQWRLLFEDIWSFVMALWINSHNIHPEPNTTRVTLPLPGFCSFNYKLYRAPPVSWSTSRHEDIFWEFVRAALPSSEDVFPIWETQMLKSVAHSGRGAASPFTRLVEEILDMKGREIQLSILRVVWLEKLLAWKMQTFGLNIYLTRTALPMLLLFSVHLTVGVLLTGDYGKDAKHVTIPVILLAFIEAVVSCFILSIKIRQLYRIPRLFVRSIFNYIDGTALCLGLTMFFLVVSKTAPPRSFLGFSTLLIWIATILMLRIYRPVGMLLLLLTETLHGVFSFLALLFFIILGFAFVPFLLLRNLEVEKLAQNPFSSFPLTISQMLSFISSDYAALEPFQTSSTAVRTLRALYIIIITILFLNTLIAILNLKIKQADKNAGNLYHLQMASLQVEIELGLLSSSERARRDWFPEWFSYSMTETEKRVWKDYVEKNPLKWTEENSFNEDKDHAPLIPLQAELDELEQAQPAAPSTTTASGSSSTAKPNTEKPTSPPQSSNGAAASRQQEAEHDSSHESGQSLNHDITPVNGPDAVGPFTDGNTGEEGQEQATAAAAAAEQASSNTKRSCKVCGKPGRLCRSCRMVAYCSEEHQKMDWKSHKSACKGKGRA